MHKAARMSEKRHGSVPLRPCMQKQLWAFGLHVSSLLSRAHDLQPSGLKDCVMSPFTWKHQQSCATSQPGVNGTCVEQETRGSAWRLWRMTMMVVAPSGPLPGRKGELSERCSAGE